jgi:hypothetical protein
VALPPALVAAVDQAPGVRLEVALAERARHWRDALQGQGSAVTEVIEVLAKLSPPPSRPLLAHCRRLAAAQRSTEALVAYIEGHLDARFAASNGATAGPVLRLAALDDATIREAVRPWVVDQIRP